jgi:methanogenic corrinoid protein MtbC1
MRRIGHGWEGGSLDVYQEHRGTQLCLAALLGLRPRLPAPEPSAPLALGGGPEADPYLLANVLVEMTLQEEGWRTENVGPNTPLASLARAARERRPRLVWLSCSHLADVEAFVAGFAGLAREAKAAGAALTVGGRALGEDVRRRLTFTHHGDTLAHLVAYARELRQRA